MDLYLDGLKFFYIWYKFIIDDIKVVIVIFNVVDKVLFFNLEFRECLYFFKSFVVLYLIY